MRLELGYGNIGSILETKLKLHVYTFSEKCLVRIDIPDSVLPDLGVWNPLLPPPYIEELFFLCY